MQDFVTIPRKDFYRMLNTLEKLEPLVTAKTAQWVNATTAMALLHCKRTKLFELAKSGAIKYKKTGAVVYCRKSIEAYNESQSNK